MNALTTPRAEQMVELGRGRRLAWTEFGTSAGRPIVWFHGTPGGGRQIPQSLRRTVQDHDVRLIVVERPGYGRSSPHRYGQIRDVTADIEHLLDAVGVERFGLAACRGRVAPTCWPVPTTSPIEWWASPCSAASFPMSDPKRSKGARLPAMAPLAGIAEAQLPPTHWPPVQRNDPPDGSGGRSGLQADREPMFPEGDRDVFAQPDMQAMFIDDLRRSARGGLACT